MTAEHCTRKLRPHETALQVVRQVNPYNSNPMGVMHGGHMLEWIVDTATLVSLNVARSYALLASIEDTVFVSPVKVGDLVRLTAWAEYVGRSSIDVSVMVETEDPRTGTSSLSTASSLTLVAVDDNLRPRPVGACIEIRESFEEEIVKSALRRRAEREARIKGRKEAVRDLTRPRPVLEGAEITSFFLVSPEDSMGYNVLHGGRLLRRLDETSALAAFRSARDVVVTGALDAMDFYMPIRVGWVVEINAALTYVGTRSMEVTAKVFTENFVTGETYHTATSYFTFVRMGKDETRKVAELSEPEDARRRKERRKRIIETLRSRETVERLSEIKRRLLDIYRSPR
ncbi:MAG: acyl-CoA thioesterase [Acidilobaceae archaeon]|nr:acyl-CoA thioesterase [Acidilobaceae archaeon]MCX8165737.1 acyl-CoA thioesterase [Acidilobaceae archaeon]MDW7974162.1 hotdog domain-containing protein [Sulfolobales archaeon]